MNYRYGEEISYNYQLIKPEDKTALQAFSCGNEQLDYFIHNELILDEQVDTNDGLPFKVVNTENGEIIGVVSLATSGIIFQVDNYTNVLPAIKIDIFAMDKKYQKMHYDYESEHSSNANDHYYFSDDIMGTFIRHCRDISNEKAIAHYIVLYADKKVKRFYIRNMFSDFSSYMVKEQNMQINANDPMYMKLD